MDIYMMEFDVLRRKAVARKVMGRGFPDEVLSTLCVQNAALSKNETSLASDGIRKTPASPEVASQTRRLLGPRGNAARADMFLDEGLGRGRKSWGEKGKEKEVAK